MSRPSAQMELVVMWTPLAPHSYGGIRGQTECWQYHPQAVTLSQPLNLTDLFIFLFQLPGIGLGDGDQAGVGTASVWAYSSLQFQRLLEMDMWGWTLEHQYPVLCMEEPSPQSILSDNTGDFQDQIKLKPSRTVSLIAVLSILFFFFE